MKVRIGGVPEHFNYPWIYGIENGLYSDHNIDLQWINFPGGTGAMVSALKNEELDLALLLTEGAVKEIALGANFKIISSFVETPLIWGIHAANEKFNIDKISSYKFAISRFGSGSHIMPYVYANSHNVKLNPDQMVVVDNIEGAREALANGKADLFFWEMFMTKPLVDSGEFFMVDKIPTPWPCFVLVANEKFWNNGNMQIKIVLEVLFKTFDKFEDINLLGQKIANFYSLNLDDVKIWLSKTKWTKELNQDKQAMKKVSKTLTDIGMLETMPIIENLFFNIQ